jgi:hypothetical protein
MKRNIQASPLKIRGGRGSYDKTGITPPDLPLNQGEAKNDEEGKMKASLRMIFLSFLIVLAMGMGTYAHAQYGAEEKPAEQAAAKPAGKLIPEDLTADFNLSFYSQYIWRGYELSRDSVVFFPTLTVGYKGFAVNLWADLDTNFGVGNEDRHFKLQETDVTVTYSNSYKPWKLNYTLGWILYDYQPVAATDSRIVDTKNQEVFLTLGLDTILKPTFSVYDQIETGQAQYFQLAISHSIAVYKDWSLDLAGWVSYLNNHSKAAVTPISDFHDGNVSAGLKIPLNNYVTVKPNLQVSFPLSKAASDEIMLNSNILFHHRQDTFVYGGIILDVAI